MIYTVTRKNIVEVSSIGGVFRFYIYYEFIEPRCTDIRVGGNDEAKHNLISSQSIFFMYLWNEINYIECVTICLQCMTWFFEIVSIPINTTDIRIYLFIFKNIYLYNKLVRKLFLRVICDVISDPVVYTLH